MKTPPTMKKHYISLWFDVAERKFCTKSEFISKEDAEKIKKQFGDKLLMIEISDSDFRTAEIVKL